MVRAGCEPESGMGPLEPRWSPGDGGTAGQGMQGPSALGAAPPAVLAQWARPLWGWGSTGRSLLGEGECPGARHRAWQSWCFVSGCRKDWCKGLPSQACSKRGSARPLLLGHSSGWPPRQPAQRPADGCFILGRVIGLLRGVIKTGWEIGRNQNKAKHRWSRSMAGPAGRRATYQSGLTGKKAWCRVPRAAPAWASPGSRLLPACAVGSPQSPPLPQVLPGTTSATRASSPGGRWSQEAENRSLII